MIWTLKKRLYRTQQRVMKTASMIIPFPIPMLLTGAGSVKNLAMNIKVRGLKNVLVVTDKILMDLKVPESFLESLKNNGGKSQHYPNCY